MRVELVGWESQGLRSPDASVVLGSREGHVPHVALVQMPNGTGKTTTLKLLRAAMSGDARHWPPNKVANVRRRGSDADSGMFRVDLRVDGRDLSIEILFDFASGSAAYFTTNPGSGGVSEGYRPPPQVRAFLADEFLSLFIFDGEFADRLLNTSMAEADRAVDALCQIYLLEDVEQQAAQNWEAHSRTKSAKTEAGLASWQEKKNAIAKRLAVIEKARKDADREASQLDPEISTLEQWVQRRVGNAESTRTEYNNALKARDSASGSALNATLELLQAYRNPARLHARFRKKLKELRSSLDSLRLPENTSAQFFTELAEQDECICGRPIDFDVAKTIRARAAQFLGSEEAGVLNSLKADIESLAREHSEESSVESLVDSLTEAARARDRAQNNVNALEKRLVDAGDQELENRRQRLAEKRKRHTELTSLIARIDADADPAAPLEQEFSLVGLQRREAEANKRIAEITETVDLRERTEVLTSILNRAAELARSAIKADLIKESNALLQSVLDQAPVEIESIDRAVRLRGQEGGSVGQTLSVGYVFLLSILSRGKNEFPLVVDSPANPIDTRVRRHIAGLIPKLSSQFVAFTINVEREGFVETLDRVEDDIEYLTLFRRSEPSEYLLKEIPEGSGVISEDSVLVRDRDFFFRFDIEDEPAVRD